MCAADLARLRFVVSGINSLLYHLSTTREAQHSVTSRVLNNICKIAFEDIRPLCKLSNKVIIKGLDVE